MLKTVLKYLQNYKNAKQKTIIFHAAEIAKKLTHQIKCLRLVVNIRISSKIIKAQYW